MTDILDKQLNRDVKDGPTKDEFFKDFESLVPDGDYNFSSPDQAPNVDHEADAKDDVNFNESISSLLGPGSAPVIEELADDEVRLSGGYIGPDGTLYTSAVVRELTGEDEEVLARARVNSFNLVRFTRALLGAVVSIGDIEYTNEVGKGLLLGDREDLILGIRRATFGKDLTYVDHICPGCGEKLDITIDLSTIETKKLADPEKREYEVPLRKGVALVRIPTVADSDAVMEQPILNEAEQNTLILSRCVISISGKKVNGSKDAVKKLGSSDRQAIVKFFSEIQPGPLYDEVKSKHEVCETEFPLFLTVDDLFRGI